MKRNKVLLQQRSDLERRRLLLKLDHIEQALPAVRAFVQAMTDAGIRELSSRSSFDLIEDPFGFELEEVSRTPASQMLDALWSFKLHDVVAGKLPVPEGKVYDCPNASGPHCIGVKELMTFDEVREHLAECVPYCHSKGYAVSDPFRPEVVFREHPTWTWTISDNAQEIMRKTSAFMPLLVQDGKIICELVEPEQQSLLEVVVA